MLFYRTSYLHVLGPFKMFWALNRKKGHVWRFVSSQDTTTSYKTRKKKTNSDFRLNFQASEAQIQVRVERKN